MKTKYFYGLIAAAGLLPGAVGCSDNYDLSLKPTEGNRTLTVDGHETAFTLDVKAVSPDVTVQVESNTLWKIELDCEGGWCTVDKVSGRGNEPFTISVLENMKEVRNCYVTVYMVDAEGEKITGIERSSIQMTVSQEVSDVRLSPSALAPFAATGNERQKFNIESNVAWTLYVTYETDETEHFVTITPAGDGMTANGDGTFSGDQPTEFYMDLAENRTAADRKAYINLRSDVATYSVEITQNKSEYSFDVSPVEDHVVNAEGGTIAFGVRSLSGWNVRTEADWITFSRTSASQGSPERVETIATISPNSSGKERSAKIAFEPTADNYKSQTVVITQRGYDAVFSISRTDSEGIVMENGAELQFELDSRFNWQISAPSWLTVNPTQGSASTSIQRIAVAVAANKTNENRTGTVTVTPLPTDFPGGVTLNPGIFNFGEVHWDVTQFGGREAAISVPWLADGYGQTYAIVEFNFYSPFRAITEAGLQWRRETDNEWETMTATPSNETEATVSFSLTDLDPAMNYVARGYVKDSDGNIKYGSESFPFRTAGQYPDKEDNPTP